MLLSADPTLHLAFRGSRKLSLRATPNTHLITTVELVTTGPFDPNTFRDGIDPPPAALGSPGTVVLFGNKSVDFHPFSGGRVSLGVAPSEDGTVTFMTSPPAVRVLRRVTEP